MRMVPTKTLALHATVLVLALGSLAYAGVRVLSTTEGSIEGSSLETRVREKVAEYRTKQPPLATTSLQELALFRTDDALIDPAQSLPHEFEYPYAPLTALYDASKTCAAMPLDDQKDGRIAKLAAWTAFSCGQAPLPPGFFESFPLMHPSGRSYAFLGAKDLSRGELKRLVHVRELGELGSGVALTPAESYFAKLGRAQLEAVYYKAEVAAGPELVLLLKKQGERILYDVHAAENWRRFFAATPLRAVKHGAGQFETGNVGWRFDEEAAARPRRQALAFAAFGLVLLSFESLWHAVRYYAAKRTETKRRTFNLQMLSHELRTPAAAMRLNLDALQSLYDELPEKGQVALLRILEAEGRMSNVLDASRMYLQAGARKLVVNAEGGVDLGALVREIADAEDGTIVVEVAREVCIVRTDRHWLAFCVGNVLSNAVKHGKAPVRLRYGIEGSGFFVEVEDQGDLDAEAFARLRQPFQTESARSGLGLGLPLVEQMLVELGGKLEFKARPTRIKLWFRGLP